MRRASAWRTWPSTTCSPASRDGRCPIPSNNVAAHRAPPAACALLAKHLDDHSLRPAAVELAVEDLLPGPEVEAALRDRDDHLMVHEQVLQVRVAVVLAAAVMAVVARVRQQLPRDVVGGLLPARRRDLVEPLERVLVQAGLVVVDPDRRRYVHGA